MKPVTLLFTVPLMALLASCTDLREKTSEEVLESPKLRAEIYRDILASEVYLSEFMDSLSSIQAHRAQRIHAPVIKWAWQSDRLDSLLDTDAEMTRRMIQRVVRRLETDTAARSLMWTSVAESPRLNTYVTERASATYRLTNASEKTEPKNRQKRDNP